MSGTQRTDFQKLFFAENQSTLVAHTSPTAEGPRISATAPPQECSVYLTVAEVAGLV